MISSSAVVSSDRIRRDRLADQERRRQRRPGGEDQRAEHQQHLATVGPQQREQPPHLPPAVVLAPDQSPQRPEEGEEVLGSLRLGSLLRHLTGRAFARPRSRGALSCRSQLRQLLALLEVTLEVDGVLEPLLGDLLVQRAALQQLLVRAAVDDPAAGP